MDSPNSQISPVDRLRNSAIQSDHGPPHNVNYIPEIATEREGDCWTNAKDINYNQAEPPMPAEVSP